MYDDLCGGMKISRAGVIAEALPRPEHVIFASASQRRKIGETAEPLIVIRDHGRDLRLLEHELRNEDGVWVASAAPGQIAAVAAKPAEKWALEGTNFFRRGNGFQQTLNVHRQTSDLQFRVERWALSV